MKKAPYQRLLAMTAASFVAMFVLMYAMVDVAANAVPNLNQVYMAGLMASPMALIEMLLMREMYANKKLNRVIIAASVAAGMLCFALIRKQAAIGDEQFLRSMIPHHAAAVLMCQEAPVEDAEIRALCESIVAGQQAEIRQMRAKLRSMNE
jgi:uncharacterized protein (DUF305 family)